MKRKLLLTVMLAAVLAFTVGLAACESTYTVTFNMDGGLPQVQEQTVKSGEKAEEPEGPFTKEGNFVFDGWTLDGQAYDFNEKVTKNITLKAKWAEAVVVTFNTDGGTPIVPQYKIKKGTAVARPSVALEKSYYTFLHWALSGNTSAYNFDTPVNADITLIAIWEYDVTLNSMSGIWTGQVVDDDEEVLDIMMVVNNDGTGSFAFIDGEGVMSQLSEVSFAIIDKQLALSYEIPDAEPEEDPETVSVVFSYNQDDGKLSGEMNKEGIDPVLTKSAIKFGTVKGIWKGTAEIGGDETLDYFVIINENGKIEGYYYYSDDIYPFNKCVTYVKGDSLIIEAKDGQISLNYAGGKFTAEFEALSDEGTVLTFEAMNTYKASIYAEIGGKWYGARVDDAWEGYEALIEYYLEIDEDLNISGWYSMGYGKSEFVNPYFCYVNNTIHLFDDEYTSFNAFTYIFEDGNLLMDDMYGGTVIMENATDWNYVVISTDLIGTWTGETAGEDDEIYTYLLIFNINGTGSLSYLDEDENETEIYEVSFQIKNNTLIVTYKLSADSEEATIIFEYDNETGELSGDSGIFDEEFTLTMIPKK